MKIVVCFMFLAHAASAFSFGFTAERKWPSTNVHRYSQSGTKLYLEVPNSPEPDSNDAIKKKINLDEIDAVALEAQAALKQAQAALQQAQQKQIEKDAISAGIGGATLGLVAGTALDIYLTANGDNIRNSLGIDVADIPSAVPPLVLGAAMGTSAFSVASSTEENNLAASLVRKTLGKTTQAAGKSIQTSIKNTAQSIVSSITSIPSKIQAYFQRKTQEAVEEVKAIPSKISTAAQQQAESLKEAAVEAVEKTVEDIKATPARVANQITTAAQETAESIKDAAVDAVERTVDDIKATPGRIVDSVQKTVDETVEKIEVTIEEAVEDVIEKVEEVTSFPGKKLDELLGGATRKSEEESPLPPTPTAPIIPKPPDVLPTFVPKQTTAVATKPSPPANIPPPSKSFDDSPRPPLTPPPLFFNVPQVSKEQPIVPPVKKETADNFVFSEMSLKDLFSSSSTSEETDSSNIGTSRQAKPVSSDSAEKKLKEDKLKAEAKAKADAAVEARKKAEQEALDKKRREEQLQAEAKARLDNEKGAEMKRKEMEAAKVSEEAKRKKDGEVAQKRLLKEKAEQEALEKKKREEQLRSKAKLKQEEAKRTAEEAKRKREEEQLNKKKKNDKVGDAAKTIQQAKPGATISLGLFKFGQRTDDDTRSTILVSSAPKGVPTLVKWKQNGDRSITGIISGSASFPDGEKITTSAITSDAVGGAVVVTESGSRYYLEESKVTQQRESDAKKKKEDESRARILAANEARDRELQDKRAIKEKMAEMKKKETDERRAAEAATAAVRKRENEERKAMQIKEREDAKEALAKAKKAEEEAAAKKRELEAKQRDAEDKKAIAEAAAAARRKEELEKREAIARARAEQTVEKAKPGATVSLGFFGFGARATDDDASPSPKVFSVAPRGVPTLNNWRRNRDGSITGIISGSPSFTDGEKITTSPITGDAIGGTVVMTVSGSKYYLEDAKVIAAKAAEARRIVEDVKKQELKAISTKDTIKVVSEPQKNINLQKREQVARAREAEEKIQQAKPGATISLGLFGFTPKDSPSEPKKLSIAPRGVATISNWRQNRDGSITGFISGSASFNDGEKITTSPITSDAVGGTLVSTVSGSRYFLEDKTKAAEETRRKQQEALSVARQAADEARRAAEAQRKELAQISKAEEKKSIGPAIKKAPAGVPSLVKWKLNRDNTITGFISGSSTFPEGEKVTTSPIVSEVIQNGEVVKTGSGSKYFLV